MHALFQRCGVAMDSYTHAQVGAASILTEKQPKFDLFLDKLPNGIIYGLQTSVQGVSAQEESSNRVLLILRTVSRSPISSNGVYDFLTFFRNGAYNLQRLCYSMAHITTMTYM